MMWTAFDFKSLPQSPYDAGKAFASGSQLKKPTFVVPAATISELHVPKLIYSSELQVVGIASRNEIQFYNVNSGKLVTVMEGVSQPDHTGHHADISCLAWDIDTIAVSTLAGYTEHARVFVVASGDQAGKVAVWDGRPIARHVENPQHVDMPPLRLKPSLCLKAHEGPVTCVDVDAFKLISAGMDTYLRVYDVMLGRCLRTLNVRHFRHMQRNRSDSSPPVNPPVHVLERNAVRYLYTTLHQIVIAVNGKVKVWDLDPECRLARWSQGGRKKKMRFKRRSSASTTITKAGCKIVISQFID